MRAASLSAVVRVASSPVPGSSGTPFASAMARAVCLSPKSRICSRRRPDEGDARLLAPPPQTPRSRSRTRTPGGSPRPPSRARPPGSRRRAGSSPPPAPAPAAPPRRPPSRAAHTDRVRIDRHHADPHPPQSPSNPNRNHPPIRNQNPTKRHEPWVGARWAIAASERACERVCRREVRLRRAGAAETSGGLVGGAPGYGAASQMSNRTGVGL